jgi:CubicO group peptidase (beta-lactamase class C family)
MAFKIHYPFIYGILLSLVLQFGGSRAMSAPFHSTSYADPGNQESMLKWKPKIDEIIRPAFESERTAGIVVGVAEGNSTFFIGYGSTNLRGGQTPGENTIFEIGSVTKVFTGLMLAKKVLEHKVALDDPVRKLLPAYFRIPKFGDREITLLDLSTHYSGLPRVPTNMNLESLVNPYKNYTGYKMREFLVGYQLPREPGTVWEYSNLGAGLLGYALGVKSNTPYKRMVLSEICGPLKLKDTRFRLNEEQLSRFAQGYNADLEKTAHWDFDVIAPAGGLRSTAADMLKLASAHLKNNGPLPQAMAIATRPYRKSGLPDNDMGLGWIIMHKGGFDILWHNGGTGGFSSFVAINKAKNIALVVLSNTMAATSGVVDDIAGSIMKCLLGIPYEIPKWPKEVKIDQNLLDTYTGNYDLTSKGEQPSSGENEKARFTLTREANRIVFSQNRKVIYKVYPESETRFFAKLIPLTVTFSKGKTDRAVRMTIRVDKEESEWRQIPAPQEKR